MNITDLVITSLETITCFDVVTGAYLFQLDELQSASLAQGQEKNDIVGKQGRKLSSMKRNKTVTVSGSNGMVSAGLLASQVGSDFESKDTEVMWYEHLNISGNKANTTYKAVGTTGAEIIHLYVRNSDGTLGTEYTQAASAAAGKFTYAPATKLLTFANDELTDGTEVVVYYKRKINAAVLENKSDKYSGKCSMYIDAFAEDSCANVYHVQFFIPKADFNGEFTFEMGDSQTIQNFEAEALSGACGAAGALWTYTVFGANAEDVA